MLSRCCTLVMGWMWTNNKLSPGKTVEMLSDTIPHQESWCWLVLNTVAVLLKKQAHSSGMLFRYAISFCRCILSYNLWHIVPSTNWLTSDGSSRPGHNYLFSHHIQVRLQQYALYEAALEDLQTSFGSRYTFKIASWQYIYISILPILQEAQHAIPAPFSI